MIKNDFLGVSEISDHKKSYLIRVKK